MSKKAFDISLWERKIEEKYQEREANRLKTLEETKRKLKDYFKNKQISKVYLTGSLLREGWFYPFSDIDIVVEDLGELYFKVFVELEELLDREVRLIELERCKSRNFIMKNILKIK